MSRKITYAIALCLIGVGVVLLSPAPSPAQSDDKNNLIRDFKAYKDRCEPETSSPPAPSKSCADEKAKLADRQHKLNLTDADLAALMKVQVLKRSGPGRGGD
ncbi:MAG: hypothetical protein ACLQME_05225 [Alphaproteobacteria bacterium]